MSSSCFELNNQLSQLLTTHSIEISRVQKWSNSAAMLRAIALHAQTQENCQGLKGHWDMEHLQKTKQDIITSNISAYKFFGQVLLVHRFNVCVCQCVFRGARVSLISLTSRQAIWDTEMCYQRAASLMACSDTSLHAHFISDTSRHWQRLFDTSHLKRGWKNTSDVKWDENHEPNSVFLH